MCGEFRVIMQCILNILKSDKVILEPTVEAYITEGEIKQLEKRNYKEQNKTDFPMKYEHTAVCTLQRLNASVLFVQFYRIGRRNCL